MTDKIQKLEEKTANQNKMQSEKLREQDSSLKSQLSKNLKEIGDQAVTETKKLENKINEQIKNSSEKLNEQDIRLKSQLSKDIKKIEDQVITETKKLENKINEQTKNSSQKFDDISNNYDRKLEERYNKIDKKLVEGFKKLGEAVDGRFKLFEQKFNENIESIEVKTNSLLERIKEMNEDFINKIKTFKEEFDIKDTVLRDIEKKHNEENTKFQNQLKPVLENLRSQQDVTKMKMDVLKKQLYKSAKEWISNEMKTAIREKEKEILMNIWIDEMGEIINNVDQLKKMNPKELKLQLNEISSTIESFKQKFLK